jgi:hypothetical protein
MIHDMICNAQSRLLRASLFMSLIHWGLPFLFYSYMPGVAIGSSSDSFASMIPPFLSDLYPWFLIALLSGCVVYI